jgi:hypothetical protein
MVRIRSHLKRIYTLLGAIWLSMQCASCVLPISLRYYVPSAEGATIKSMSCSRDPPYVANWLGGVSPQFELMVGLVQRSLWTVNDPTLTMIIDPGRSAKITIDPTLIRVIANGALVVPKTIQYIVGKSQSAPTLNAAGPIEIESNYLIIHIPLVVEGAAEVETKLPPVVVGGQAKQLPDVAFRLEKHSRLITIAGNC